MRTRPAVGLGAAVVVVASTTLLTSQGASAARTQPRVEPRASGLRVAAPVSARVVTPAPHAEPTGLLGGPGTWTKFTTGKGNGFNEPGLLRTADGKLHVVWVKQNKPNSYSIAYTTFALGGGLLNAGVAVANWQSFQTTPRLVPDGKNIRLIFNGGQDGNASNKFSIGARYTATSANGTSWSLFNGSLSSRTLFNLPVAATAELDGTPVSAQGENNAIWYHVGVDTAIPSTTTDGTITGQVGSGLEDEAIVTDKKTGAVWLSWFQGFESGQGYYAEQILPTKTPAVKAPNSGNQNWANNDPFQQVALAARVGGGVYLAYCQESKTSACAHINLWQLGTKTVRVVPGSATGTAKHVTLSAGAKGRLVVGWFDSGKNVIKVIRTNTHATAWGVLRTVNPPVKANNLAYFDGLFSESSSGRIDLIANVQQYSNGAPTFMYHTQVLEGLKVTASPTKVSHKHTSTVTFKVTDAGEAVAGATVSFDGKTAHTNSSGVAKISVTKGQAKGSRTATASKTGYYKGVVSVKIT